MRRCQREISRVHLKEYSPRVPLHQRKLFQSASCDEIILYCAWRSRHVYREGSHCEPMLLLAQQHLHNPSAAKRDASVDCRYMDTSIASSFSSSLTLAVAAKTAIISMIARVEPVLRLCEFALRHGFNLSHEVLLLHHCHDLGDFLLCTSPRVSAHLSRGTVMNYRADLQACIYQPKSHGMI